MAKLKDVAEKGSIEVWGRKYVEERFDILKDVSTSCFLKCHC